MNPVVQLVWPAPEYLRSYCEALRRGWSPNNLRPQVAEEELAAIQANPDAYFERIVNFQGDGLGVKLPDGTVVPRMPGYRKWMWDGDFCGSIQLRWLNGTHALPPYCLGSHWLQRRSLEAAARLCDACTRAAASRGAGAQPGPR